MWAAARPVPPPVPVGSQLGEGVAGADGGVLRSLTSKVPPYLPQGVDDPSLCQQVPAKTLLPEVEDEDDDEDSEDALGEFDFLGSGENSEGSASGRRPGDTIDLGTSRGPSWDWAWGPPAALAQPALTLLSGVTLKQSPFLPPFSAWPAPPARLRLVPLDLHSLPAPCCSPAPAQVGSPTPANCTSPAASGPCLCPQLVLGAKCLNLCASVPPTLAHGGPASPDSPLSPQSRVPGRSNRAGETRNTPGPDRPVACGGGDSKRAGKGLGVCTERLPAANVLLLSRVVSRCLRDPGQRPGRVPATEEGTYCFDAPGLVCAHSPPLQGAVAGWEIT